MVRVPKCPHFQTKRQNNQHRSPGGGRDKHGTFGKGGKLATSIKTAKWFLFFCLVQPLVLVSIIPTPNHPTQVIIKSTVSVCQTVQSSGRPPERGWKKKNHPLSSRQPFAEKWRYLPASYPFHPHTSARSVQWEQMFLWRVAFPT